MTIQIRPFTPADRTFILSLVERFTDFDLPEWRTRQEVYQSNQETLIKILDEPAAGSCLLVAEDDILGPAGFIYVLIQKDYFNGRAYGYISDLAVAGSFEGQGVGRLLLDSAEEWARAQGFDRLALYVFAGNQRARAIYEKRGFQPEVIKYVKPL